eukprot:SAG31_NODE_1153_length_9640_cov_2.830206_11_plen_76_part_00
MLSEVFRDVLRGSAQLAPVGGQSQLLAVVHLYTCDTFSISALHLAIKVPYFSDSGHKNEKVTNYLVQLRVAFCGN